MLDYRIETFITLCKERNYSKTAQKLCITQPAVTQHIQYLERFYNCKLFEYENKQLKLTQQGMILERMAVGLSASSNRFKAMIQELEKKQKNFSIGVTATVSEYMISRIITPLLKEDPDLNIHVRTDSTPNLINQLKNGTIECAFIEGPFNGQEFRYHKFITGSYTLASKNKLTCTEVKDLLTETIITKEPDSSGFQLLSQALIQQGSDICDFANHVYTNDPNLIKQLMLNGSGIGLLYKDAIQKELDDGLLYEVPLNLNLTQDFHFITLMDNMFFDAYDKFFDFACNTYHQETTNP